MPRGVRRSTPLKPRTKPQLDVNDQPLMASKPVGWRESDPEPTRRPVRRTRGPRRPRAIPAAPEASTGVIDPGPRHPYYCTQDGRGGYFVVAATPGQPDARVAGAFKTPREAIDRMNILNDKATEVMRDRMAEVS